MHVDLWLARARLTRPRRPRRRCPERTEPLAPRHVARQQTGPVCATGSTNDPKPEREQRTPPVSKESSPCFLSVILLLEKLSKSLIPLSDCPFVLNRLPVFLGKSPCFREKTGPCGRMIALARGLPLLAKLSQLSACPHGRSTFTVSSSSTLSRNHSVTGALCGESGATRTRFQRKADSNPVIADSR
jgi:hypothetical protein